MNPIDELKSMGRRSLEENQPFTAGQVVSRYHLARVRRLVRRRVRIVISSAALALALISFLFININGELSPGFFDPTRVSAGTPFPTLTSMPPTP